MIKGQFATQEEAQAKANSENNKMNTVGIPLRCVIIPRVSYQLIIIPENKVNEFNTKADDEKLDFARSSMQTFNETPLTEQQLQSIQTAYNEYTNDN